MKSINENQILCIILRTNTSVPIHLISEVIYQNRSVRLLIIMKRNGCLRESPEL